MAAYGFLAAYASYDMQKAQLDSKKMRLSVLNQQQAEILRKQDMLNRARLFSEHIDAFKLSPKSWFFYDVNVQGEFRYESAQQIIQQCSDTELAYYWPISLKIVSLTQPEELNTSTTTQQERKDVQLTIKGKFVARK